MKRRTVKKWMNRYINPLINTLKTTDCSIVNVTDNGYVTRVASRNYGFANGHVKSEGQRIQYCNNLMLNIKRTGESIQYIMDTHKHVYLRNIRIVNNQVIVRLITE